MRLTRTAGITALATALLAPLLAGSGTAASQVTLCSASGIGAASCNFQCPAPGTTIFISASAQAGAATAYGRCGLGLPFLGAGAVCGSAGTGNNGCTSSLQSSPGAGALSAVGGGTVTVRAWIVA